MTGALKGLRVLNTRPVHQARALTDAIAAEGGIAVEWPALVILPTPTDWTTQLPPASTVYTCLFTSANAVEGALKGLRTCDWHVSRAIAIGRATASALREAGVASVTCPEQPDSEHVLQMPALQQVQGQRVLLFRGEGGRRLLADTLMARGALLHEYAVYRREAPPADFGHTEKIWRDGAVDIILCTSTEGLHNLFTRFGEAASAWLCATPWLVAGSRVAQEARARGVRNVFSAQADALLQALVDYQQGTGHAESERGYHAP